MQGLLPLDQRTFLTAAYADTPMIRTAWIVGMVSLAVFLTVLPIAKIPINPIPSFVPIYVALMAVGDLITSVVLFGQYRFLRSRGLLILAGGYLFTAATTTAYTLVYPGMFAPAGLFGAGPQTTSALYMFWHAGFPLMIVAYAFLKSGSVPGSGSGRSSRAVVADIVLMVLAVLAAVAGFTVFATAGNQAIPEFLVNNVTTLTGHLSLAGVWSLSFLAFIALWFRAPHTVLDIWLLFVLAVWIFDLALSAIFNSGRYDLGWYFGRAYGLLGANFLLMVLLTELVANYGRLFELSAELRRANYALEELSFRDGLTGLDNRRSFDQYLASQVAASRRYQQPLALIVCDVDHFKLFNDRYGHQAGDECLKQVAATLQACCRRPSDRAARYGGEEFALILPDTDLRGAEGMAETVRAAVARLNLPHEGSPTELHITLSGGVAVFLPPSPTSEADLIRAADHGLYQAKTAGRNRMVLSESLHR